MIDPISRSLIITTMRAFVMACLCMCIGACVKQTTPQTLEFANAKLNINAPALTYTNGLWYKAANHSDSSAKSMFERKDMHTKDGVFVAEQAENALIIDLQGAYIINPFGEAHNHSVDSQWTIDTAKKYLREGVFYYKNPNSIGLLTTPNRSYWRRPETLDVTFSNGGISTLGGHPNILYQQLAKNYNMQVEDLVGDAFYAAPTLESLQAQWPEILKARPDFIKLYLLRHNTDKSEGLSEAVFREAIKLAKEADLATTVHLESTADLKLAVDAGADESAHLVNRKKDTAFEQDGLIPDELVESIAQQGLVTVTTTRITTLQYGDKPELLAQIQQVQKQNLRRLFEAGAPIAIGTDSFTETLSSEIETLRNMQVFSDPELLVLLMNTPRVSIFPGRAIGRFSTGHEASFIGLTCDPFEDFDCIKKITHRVKQGVDLNALINE